MLVESDPRPKARQTTTKPTGVAQMRNLGKYFSTTNHIAISMYMIPWIGLSLGL